MKTKRWRDLDHGISRGEMSQLKREAIKEYERLGFGALRKARQQTQVELARKLGISQAGISSIESNSDLLLSTLAKYVHALGGEVQVRAVFPEATFDLAAPALQSSQPNTVPKKRSVAERKPATTRKALRGVR